MFNSAQVYPKYRDLNQIQLIIANLYIAHYRAIMWVSIDAIMNRKQNKFKQEERNSRETSDNESRAVDGFRTAHLPSCVDGTLDHSST